MNEFIEKNRRLLKFYCDALRSIGQVVLALGLFGVCAITLVLLLSKFENRHAPESLEMIMAMPLAVFKIFFIGIGILGLGQFVRYLVEEDYKPGWILCHGSMLFYLYALLIILSVVWAYAVAPGYRSEFVPTGLFMIFAAVFSTTVRVLVLVGLGQILRHLMPVIEESKTLV